MVLTNGMASFRAMLKRGHRGICHKFSPNPLDNVQEFAGMAGKRVRLDYSSVELPCPRSMQATCG